MAWYRVPLNATFVQTQGETIAIFMYTEKQNFWSTFHGQNPSYLTFPWSLSIILTQSDAIFSGHIFAYRPPTSWRTTGEIQVLLSENGSQLLSNPLTVTIKLQTIHKTMTYQIYKLSRHDSDMTPILHCLQLNSFSIHIKHEIML